MATESALPEISQSALPELDLKLPAARAKAPPFDPFPEGVPSSPPPRVKIPMFPEDPSPDDVPFPEVLPGRTPTAKTEKFDPFSSDGKAFDPFGGVAFPEVEGRVPAPRSPDAPAADDVPFPEVAQPQAQAPAAPTAPAKEGGEFKDALKYVGGKLWRVVRSPYTGYEEMYKLGKEAIKGTGRPTVGGILEEYVRPSPPDPADASYSNKSVGGFAGNVLKSTYKGVRDIGESLATAPIAGAKAGYDLYSEASKPMRPGYGPMTVFKDWQENIPKQIGDALIEKYAKNYQAQNPGEWVKNEKTGKMEKREASGVKAFLDTAYEDPFGVVLDAAAVKDLGAASVKAVGKAVGSKSLVETGNAIAHIEETLARKTVDKVLPEKWSEYLRNRKEVLGYKGEEMSRAQNLAKEDDNALMAVYTKLTPAESKIVRDVHLLGEGAGVDAVEAVRNNPTMYRAYTEYGEYLKNNREAFLQAEGLLDRKVLTDRVAAQYAVAKYGDMEPATIKVAKQEIAAMKEFKPVYVPTRREVELMAASEMIPFQKPEFKQGKVGFLERFTGKAPFYEMPQEYIPKVVNSWRKTEGNIRWVRKVQDSPTLVRAVSKAEAGREAMLPTQGIFSKYFDEAGKYKAKALFQKELIAKYGHDQAMGMLLHDAATQKRWKQISDIVANPAVRHILRMEFSKLAQTPGMFLRAYDKLIGYFRVGATTLNPHYYVGNALGDAVLSLINGTLPTELRRADRLKDVAPMQATRAASQVAEGAKGKLLTMFDYLNEVDAAGKRGIIVKKVAQNLRDAGIRSFELEGKLREILPAIEDLSDAQVARGRLQESIAKGIDRKTAIGRAEAEAQKALQSAATPAEKATAKAELAKVKGQKTKLMKDLTGRMAESGDIQKFLPEMQEKAAIVRPAVERANAFFADYLGMGPIQQYLFRRLVPFFPFNKAMATLAFKLPFIAPRSTFLWNRYSAMMASQIDDPQNPGYLKNYMPMFLRENGDTVWASMKGLSPFGGLRRSMIFGVNVPAIAAFWEQNPLISVGLKGVGLKTVFSRSSIPYGELLTDAHNGAVHQFEENGSVRKVIDEPDLLKGVSEFFPSVRLAEKVLIPYQMAPEGWLLHPVPSKDRAGRVTPKPSLWDHPGQTLLDLLGVRTIEKNAGQAKAQEMRKKVGIINDAKRQIMNAAPEKRQAMMEHLKDWIKTGMEFEQD